MQANPRTLSFGTEGADVTALHAQLLSLGAAIAPDELAGSRFGSTTRRALGEFQAKTQLPVSGIVDGFTTEALNEAASSSQAGMRVLGSVRYPGGQPASGLTVRAFDRDLRREQTLGETRTDEKGYYQIAYTAGQFTRAEKASADLFLRVFQGQETIYETALEDTLFNAPALAVINVDLASGGAIAENEYQRILDTVTPLLDGVALGSLEESSKVRDVTFLAGETGFTARQIAHFAVAQKLASAHKIDAAFFYALLATDTLLTANLSGAAGIRFAIDLSADLEALYYDIVLLPADTITGAVKQAIVANLVNTKIEGQLPAILKQLAGSLGKAQAYVQDQRPKVLFGQLQGFLAAGKAEAVQTILQQDSLGDLPSLLQRLQNASVFSTATDGASASAVAMLSDILGYDDQIIDQVRKSQGIQSPDDIRQLARMNTDDWSKLLRKGVASIKAGAEPIREPLIALHATALARKLEKRFPTTAFAAAMERDTKAAAEPGAQLLTLVAKQPDFDLATGNLDLLLKDSSAASQPPSDAAKASLKAMQRVFKIAPTYRHTKVLLDRGVHSAAGIHAMGQTQFVKAVTADGTFTLAEAQTAFQKASDIHAASALLAGQLQGAASALHISALTANMVPAQLDAVTKDFPNLKSLFQLADYCACKECLTVHSAAAYVVDVLQFLKTRLVVDSTLPPPAVSQKIAKDVLFERRPDLGDTDLSCDNTNTPIPYIDIVCELLEDVVAPDPGIPFSGALASGLIPGALLSELQTNGFPFTDKAAVYDADIAGNRIVRDAKAVCKLSVDGGPNQWRIRRLRQTYGNPAQVAAAPEYLNTAAYDTLANSTFAFALPFDLFHQETRAYFSQFDVSRADLMRALAIAAGPLDRDIAAESLGLSNEERQLIANADVTAAGQNIYWNSGAAAATDVAKVVDPFLNKTGLSYPDLQTLLALGWINPGNALFIRYLDNSCDLTKQEIQNLDNAVLDRLHRFIRLWKKTGWSPNALDRVIRAPRIANGVLDDACLTGLAQMARLQTRLKLDAVELCNLYDVIPSGGDDSRYAAVFLDPAAVGTVNTDFLAANVHQNELNEQTTPGSGKKLSAYTEYLALCLGMTVADCARLTGALGPGAILSMDAIARVYARNLLSKTLGLSAPDLLILENLTGIDVLASPASALLFLDKLAKLRASGLMAADLQYLLMHEAENLPSRVLPDTAITGVLQGLQSGFQIAFANNRSPFNPAATADENKNAVKDLLAKIPGLTADDLSLFVSIFDDAWLPPASQPALTAAQFIDQKLAAYFDTTAIKTAQAALGGATPPKETERNTLIQSVAGALSQYFFIGEKNALLNAAIIKTFKLPADIAGVVLEAARLKQPPAGGNRTLLDLLTDDILIDRIDTPPSPPVITPAAFDLQFKALRLLHTMNILLGSLKQPADTIRWMLANNGPLGWMELDNLAYDTAIAPVTFGAWEQLQDAARLLATYPPAADASDPTKTFSVQGLFDLILAPGTAIADVLAYLARLTGWAEDTLTALDNHFGFSSVDLAPYRSPATYRRFEAAVPLLRTLGLDLVSALSVCKSKLAAADAALMRQALKTRYAEADWLGVLKAIQDPLRQKKRDALVAYLLCVNPAITSSDDLYDYFLIDVEMCSCMPTSRIVQAHATLQLFVQRCLMGLEPHSVANLAQDSGWDQWKWMANYRVWEANRKIFLYPENWIDPQLRDDKSELFETVEDTLQQNALTDQSLTDAASSYLEQLDDIAQLDVMATYYQTDISTMHVFARTKGGDPAIYYYRQFIEERQWTPWERIDLDIAGDHLLAFDRNSRLTLAWPVFTQESDPNPASTVPNQSQQGQSVPMQKTAKRWRVQMAVSERVGTTWSPRKVSKGSLGDNVPFSTAPAQLENFMFFVWSLGAGQAISCAAEGYYYGSFNLTGCKGYPEPSPTSVGAGVVFLPWFKDASLLSGRWTERGWVDQTDDMAIKTIFNIGTYDTIVNMTPGTFRVTYPMQMSLIDWFFLWLELATGQASAIAGTKGRPYIPLGTFMPYFYGDSTRSYVIVPGLYQARAKDPKQRIEETFSDIWQFVTGVIALFQKYLLIYQQDPAHDLQKLLQQLVADAEFVRLRNEFALFRSLQYGLKFENFYHPLVCFLRATLYRAGIPGLMQRDSQLKNTGFNFQTTYQPAGLVVQPYPIEDIDFSREGAYSSYNWELFFHLPFEIAQRLNQDQQFEAARDWLHYIFNPVGATDAPAPQKYWVTKPFFQTTAADYLSQRIDNILYAIASDPSGATIADLKSAVAEWRDKPFSPHVVARSRPVAYQLAVVMKYVQNLIDWGDNLFRQFTRESVTQATQLYILADKLLGPKPRIVPPAVTPPVETFNQLEAKVDLFGNALLDLENMIPDLGLLPHGGAELPPSPITVSALYFCIPPNDNMLAYWDTVMDRLFKIRHCQNIDGVESILALFSPPIDPGALVRAAAAGIDASAFVAGLGAPLPNYRFSTMSQKAIELTQQVGALGTSLLQALEKRDAEALARLRSQQELSVLRAVRAVKVAAIAEAQGALEGLNKTRQVTEERRSYYAGQSYMNAWEWTAVGLSLTALGCELASQIGHLGAAVVQAIPQVELGGAGAFGSPLATVSNGGQTQGAAAVTAADVLSIIAHASDRSAAMAMTQGGYRRRQDEWDFQVRLAGKELAQIDQQIVTANLHLDMLNKDLAAHDTQNANADQTDTFLRGKYTNQELYDWMTGQVSAVYFKAYQLAFDMAKKAERCFAHELGSDATFISFSYWNSLKSGLMTAEPLLHDIRRMESAYLDRNRREYELTKHVSLAQLDPQALLELKNTGKCLIQIPEALFDLDHPGHYMRRLRSVSMSIPCVAGPYTSISGELSLISNRYRKSAGLRSGATSDKDKYMEQAGNDERFTYNVGTIQSIATSSAQTDSGLFELNFRDERYLPFEGTGAIGTWQLQLPGTIRQFDYGTISDVILHLRYTARDGGSAFRTCVESALRELLNEMTVAASRTGLFQAYNFRQQFPNEWWQLKQTNATQITLTPQHLPFLTQGHSAVIDQVTWFARVSGDPATYAMSVDGTTFTLNRTASLANLCAGSSGLVQTGMLFALSAADTGNLTELTLLVHYTLQT